jgi:hypothetical protein
LPPLRTLLPLHHPAGARFWFKFPDGLPREFMGILILSPRVVGKSDFFELPGVLQNRIMDWFLGMLLGALHLLLHSQSLNLAKSSHA